MLIEPGLCAEVAVPVTSIVCPTWLLRPVVFPVSTYEFPELSVRVNFPADCERQPSKVDFMPADGSVGADMLEVLPEGGAILESLELVCELVLGSL